MSKKTWKNKVNWKFLETLQTTLGRTCCIFAPFLCKHSLKKVHFWTSFWQKTGKNHTVAKRTNWVIWSFYLENFLSFFAQAVSKRTKILVMTSYLFNVSIIVSFDEFEFLGSKSSKKSVKPLNIVYSWTKNMKKQGKLKVSRNTPKYSR